MKKLIILSIFASFSISIFAQNDIILKTNGDEMQGKITKINSNDLQFIYQNETLEYTVSKTNIAKITFASGRIEFFNKTSAKSNVSLENHHNKVAVLPFGYIKNQETSNAIMTEKIQQETFTIFKKRAVVLKFQDPLTTNALLVKAGVQNNNLQGFTMGEICNILGVEYVIQGLVSIDKTTQTFLNSSTTNTQKKSNNPYVNSSGHIVGDVKKTQKTKSYSSSYATAVQNYETNITMNVYNDKGSSIFTKEHVSFWQTQDAYLITLEYLAKRTPIYKK